MTDHHPTTAQAAPGWYPDGSGGQRWWDGRGWTDHTAPAPAPAAPTGAAIVRPALPAGTSVDNAWVWVVSLIMVVASLPFFFFDMSGYMRAIIEAEVSGSTSGIPSVMANYFVFLAVTQVLGLAAWGFTVFAAFRDYKHLESVGVVRPFHWAFAFIPYTIVYLIGRHVVLRKVVRTAGWPLWAHIASYGLVFVAAIVWAMVVMQSMFNDLMYMSFT